MPDSSAPSPAGRDRAVRRVRVLAWSVAAATAGLSAGVSVVAAHAFKGHDGRARTTETTAAVPSPRAAARARVHVPRAQHVPAIAGAPAPLQPPAAAPTAAPPVPQQQQQQPETSGGS
jgi:hypothetical protein